MNIGGLVDSNQLHINLVMHKVSVGLKKPAQRLVVSQKEADFFMHWCAYNKGVASFWSFRLEDIFESVLKKILISL